jgi:hypothetical protein
LASASAFTLASASAFVLASFSAFAFASASALAFSAASAAAFSIAARSAFVNGWPLPRAMARALSRRTVLSLTYLVLMPSLSRISETVSDGIAPLSSQYFTRSVLSTTCLDLSFSIGS